MYYDKNITPEYWNEIRGDADRIANYHFVGGLR